ncbi:MAG: exo-alpha-sialidase [Opitutales bacterium]|jgi:predicted neuraminidase|nr:exo-alpha-sialidase [Opitutales bacterium]
MKWIALRKWITFELTILLAFGLVVFVSDVFGVMDQSSLPPVAKPGKGAVVSGELIFSIENKPTKECHASTIVETPSGLVAAWFAGTRERDPDVGIWVSREVNGNWSEPTEVVNGVQSMNLRYPCWNPVLFQPEDGPLLLFYKVGPNPREWWGMLTTSEDDGKTWSWPTKLGEHWAVGHLLGPVKNKPIQLEDGSILCPTSTEVELTDDDTRWRVHFEVTRDLGKTWDVIGPIHDGIEFDSIQPSILTYANGDMQILCRSMQQVVSQSWSSDGGRSWTNMAATDLPNPSAGTDAVSLADGRQLIVYNHTTRKTKIPSRQILNVAVSGDGKNWEPVVTLEHESKPRPADGRHWGEYSYPAMIQTSDGLVHITYTYNREGVKHVILDPKEL